MFPSSNAPPSPSYDTATNYSSGNQYDTKYSDPARTNYVQPELPQPFGQPQGYMSGQPPYPRQQYPAPPPASLTNSPPYPVGNQHNLPGQQQVFNETKRQELQRQAIIAMVCFFPLGYWAWIEYQKTVELYSRGNVEEGKQQEQKVHKISLAAKAVAFLIILIIVFNYFDILGLKNRH